MKRVPIVGCFLVSLCCASVANADQRFLATLTGAQEVPAVTTTAIGTGTVVLNTAETQITVNLSFTGLAGNANGAHIHGPGAPGVNAPIAFNLTPGTPATPSGTIAPVTFAVTATQAAQLKAGQFYFNIHNASFPAGEIRGQILVAPPERFTAMLDGTQENPPVSSPGSGTGVVLLNATETQIVVNLTFSNLSDSAVAAHIHGPAPSGTNAPIVFNISGTPSAPSGSVPQQTFDVTPTQVSQLRDGLLYFNVHTGPYPGGEIRGQIRPAPLRGFRTSLDGEQRVPSVASPGSGTGAIGLDPAETRIYVNLAFGGLSSHATAVHIHESPGFGRNGPIVFDLTSVTPSAPTAVLPGRSFVVTAAQAAKLKDGLWYFDIHTTNHNAGEIRGQIVWAPTRRYRAELTGDQPTVPANTPATGLGHLVLNETEVQVRGGISFQDLTHSLTGAHLHGPAFPGFNGPVLFNFIGFPDATSGVMADQSFSITPAQVEKLKSGEHYLDLHTVNYPAGEIRGQLNAVPLLTVERGGTGAPVFAATSTPAGISCGGDCSKAYDTGTIITLAAGSPATGSTFRGWTGGGCQGLTCSVQLSSDTTVTAIYTLDTTSFTFTDDPLVPGSPIKATHIVQLRNAINTLRTNNGLPLYTFTNTPLTAGMTARAVHVGELRSALAGVYLQRFRPMPVYMNPVLLEPARPIRALDINELRAAFRLIE